MRALRGATTATGNSRDEILEATREMVLEAVSQNSVKPDDLICIIFSSTPDLNAAFPASAAREAGLTMVPLFGAQDRHVYLRGAAVLRPDLMRGR